MQEKDINTPKAYNPWYAIQDAKRRSIANQSHFSQAKQVAADRMAMVLPMVYKNSGVYINYRAKFIAVKVSEATVKNSKDLVKLEADWTKLGYTKRVSAQGIIYRIPKK
jgi:hypothetical protein